MWIIWWKPPTIKLWPPIQAPISHGSQTSQKRKVEFLHLWGFLKKPTLKIIVGNVLISFKHVKSIQNACRIIIYSTDTYAEASWLGVPKQNYSITGILCISDTWNHRFQMYICNVYIYICIYLLERIEKSPRNSWVSHDPLPSKQRNSAVASEPWHCPKPLRICCHVLFSLYRR